MQPMVVIYIFNALTTVVMHYGIINYSKWVLKGKDICIISMFINHYKVFAHFLSVNFLFPYFSSLI